MYTVFISLNENTKDYVSAGVYNPITTELIGSLPSIIKPDDVNDYNDLWKKNLEKFYKDLIKKDNPTAFVVTNLVENANYNILCDWHNAKQVATC